MWYRMSWFRRNKKDLNATIKATDDQIIIRGTKQQLRLVANRILPDEIARQYDTPFPVNFAQPFPLSGETPPGSGLAFKFSPYMQFYTKVYGVMPNSDFTKYRLIYRTQPDIKARIDKRVNLAVGKGFTIQCDDPEGKEAAEWLDDWAKRIKLDLMLSSAGSDMLVYGTAFQEVIWEPTSPINQGESSEQTPVSGPLKAESKTVTIHANVADESASEVKGGLRPWVEETALCPKCHEHTLTGIRYVDKYTFYGDVASFKTWICSNPECKTDPNRQDSMPFCSDSTADAWMEHASKVMNQRFTDQDIQVIQPEPPAQDSSITYIKDLDPLYIRPRADAYGNIFGYYQWINYPPVLLGPSAVICYRWNIKSWGYETIYGTSELMPVIRYYVFRQQLENDLATWVHTYAKPVVHMMLGTPERPYTDLQQRQFAQAWKKRQAGADFATKGDVTSEVIETTVGRGNAMVEWLNYVNTQIHSPLSIPDVLMGTQGSPQGGGGSNRSTATVTMEDVIVQSELLQKALTRPWEQDVFPLLLKANGFNDAIAQLRYYVAWKPVFEEDPNTRMTNLINFRKAGIYSINQCLAAMPDGEPIDPEDPRYKPEYDLPDYPVPAPAKSPDQIQAEADAKASMMAPTNLTEPEGLDQGEGTALAVAQTNRRIVSSLG